jgi:hypothetical protein
MLLAAPNGMEAAIRQYEIQPRVIHFSWWKKIALFFAISCFAFGFRWIVDSTLHWERRSTVWALIMAVALGAVFAFRPENRWFPTGGSLIIGDDFIEGRTQYNGFTFKKRMSREKVKSISEDRRGLCVMDRSKFAARVLGFVFIPSAMPEYQEIRSELALWAPIQVKS